MLPAFGWQALLTHWEFAPVVTAAVAFAAGLYLWGAWRVGRRHPARPWPWWRTAAFLGGLAVVVFALESGVGAYDDVLFFDHMIQHLLLIMVAPPLLVVGQPITLLLHASRNPLHTWVKRAVRSRAVSFITWPPFVFIAYAAIIVGTHLTGLAHLTLVNPAWHDAEHVLYLVAGYLFFLPLVGREPIRWHVSYPIRMLVLVVAMPVDTFTGLVLGYTGSSYVIEGTGPRPPGSPSPLQDMRWAGALMWIGGDAIMLLFLMIVLWMWSRDEQASSPGWLEAARKSSFDALIARGHASPEGAAATTATANTATAPGASVIDDDEHLAAYNAYLASLNKQSPRSS
jgi:cytochrome c oxidase assembly factor CtaG